MKVMQKSIKVKPNSQQQKIIEEADGSLSISLKSPPVDGKANEELNYSLKSFLYQSLELRLN